MRIRVDAGRITKKRRRQAAAPLSEYSTAVFQSILCLQKPFRRVNAYRIAFLSVCAVVPRKAGVDEVLATPVRYAWLPDCPIHCPIDVLPWTEPEKPKRRCRGRGKRGKLRIRLAVWQDAVPPGGSIYRDGFVSL